jgi:hypothetical protein
MSGSSYYVPHETKWPFLATVALIILFIGLANYMNDESDLTLDLYWISPIINCSLWMVFICGKRE